MFKQLQGLKNSKEINPLEQGYKVVEHKMAVAKEPTMAELRQWYIYKAEKIYDTKMLGTNIHYCYSTFKKLKEKYNFNNLALAAKLDIWLVKYKQLGYTGIFDFSRLNTDWILQNLDSNTPNSGAKKTTYQNKNVNSISTKDRRV